MRRIACLSALILGAVGVPAAWGVPQATPGSAPAAGGEVKAVGVGPQHGCGIRGDGKLWCWGKDDRGQASPPDGAFLQISAGRSHTCAIATGGNPVCWGSDERGQTTPPEDIAGRQLIQLSVGEAHTCGILEDGSVRCWGCRESADPDTALLPKDRGQCDPPEGRFTQVSAGHGHTCGVRHDGTVACWGSNASGCATPPKGKFVQVSASKYRTCGLREDGTLACWGRESYGESTPPAGAFQQVATGAWHTCGLASDGTVSCWGNDRRGQCEAPGGVLTSISAAGEHACGVTKGGTVVCWGDNLDGQSSPYATPLDTGIRALVERATEDPDLQQGLAVVLICPSLRAPESFQGLATIRVIPGRKLNLVDDWGQHSNPTLVHEQALSTEQYAALLEALLSVDWTAASDKTTGNLQITHPDNPGALNLRLPAEPLCTAAWETIHLRLRILGQHVAEQLALLDRIIQGDVRVSALREPPARHVSLHRGTVLPLEHRHRVGLDVKRRVGERTPSRESH